MTTISIDECQITDEEKFSDYENDKSLSSESSNECPFNAEISAKLSQAFAKATGIDIEFAVQLLKDHGWNIDQALEATYEAKEQAQSMLDTKQTWKKSDGNYLKILSWNTDTSDSDEIEFNDLIEQRTETIIAILLREQPDVILLQQVGTTALTLIITSLSMLYDDESVQIDSPNNCNYVSIFTRKSSLKKKEVSIIQNSDNWKMLKVEVEYKNSITLDLFNAMIDENTAAFCFEQLHTSHTDRNVLSGISSKITDSIWDSHVCELNDVWEMTGKQPGATYTFDPELNSNIHGNEIAQRSDRLFFRSHPSIPNQLKPVHIELEGIQHIKTSNVIFPSTHWAIQSYFDIVN